jgi:ribonuclease Z
MMTFAVTILGSGGAVPLVRRNPSAQVLNIHERLFLLDCAEGTQVQLRKNRIKFHRINHIYITHLHGDHYFGIMGLITTYHLLGRNNELHVFAPAPLEEIINTQLEASNTVLRYTLIFHPVDTEKSLMIYEDELMSVTTVPLEHNFPTCGFFFREKRAKRNIRKDFLEGKQVSNGDIKKIKEGSDYTDSSGNVYANEDITLDPPEPRSYAYITDTAYHEPIVPIIKGASLLYHEATFMEDKAQDAKDKYHSTALQAATIAKKANVKKLVLGHYSARYRSIGKIQEEAQEVFPNTIMADDGKLIIVNSD